MNLAQYETEASYKEAGITMPAERAGDDYVLNGTKMFVMDANIADKYAYDSLYTMTKSGAEQYPEKLSELIIEMGEFDKKMDLEMRPHGVLGQK